MFGELYEVDPSGDDTNPFGIRLIDSRVMPLAEGPAVVFGVDLAKARDYTVIIGLNEGGEVCHLERFHHVPWTYIVERVTAAAALAPTVVDATGVGSPVIDMVLANGEVVDSYMFTQASKAKLMQGIAYAMAQGAIAYPEEVAQELRLLEFRYTPLGISYSAPEGYHDDQVMALGLAIYQKGQYAGYGQFQDLWVPPVPGDGDTIDVPG